MGFFFREFEDNLILELCGRQGACSAIKMLKQGRPVDWRYVAAAAEAHKVAARLSSHVLALPLPERTKNRIASAKSAVIAALRENAARRYELKTIVSALSSRGIECMLIKGLSLDRSMLRRSGDIDVLVRPDRLLEAIETIMGLPGYLYAEPSSEWDSSAWSYYGSLTAALRARILRTAGWKHEFHLHNTRRGAFLELHVNIFPREHRSFNRVGNLDILLEEIDRIWKAGRWDPELECMTPCQAHSLLLMCLHNALKRSPANNRFRLSTILDIDTLAASFEDWEFFMSECVELRVAPFVFFSLRLAKRLLGSRVPARVLSVLKRECTGFQIMLTRFHLRCVSSLRINDGSFLYRWLYQSLGPFAFGGTMKDRVKGALLMPFWLQPLEKTPIIRLMDGGSSANVLLLYLLNPFRRAFLGVQKTLGKRRFLPD